ncbi:MAG TPA: hypothetical protein VMG59_04610 [Phycisphaerae bacterium]|nr:hypothetical protein [Phycisphaerae bacterium]
MFPIDQFLRIAHNLTGRLYGPMAFRLIIQPIMAAIMAMRDGCKDAKKEVPDYFGWSLITDPARRPQLLREAFKAVFKIFIVAILIDLIYQWEVFHWFYPGEALIVATILALVPYLIFRGPAQRLWRYFLSKKMGERGSKSL